jgi:hypothetical protein
MNKQRIKILCVQFLAPTIVLLMACSDVGNAKPKRAHHRATKINHTLSGSRTSDAGQRNSYNDAERNALSWLSWQIKFHPRTRSFLVSYNIYQKHMGHDVDQRAIELDRMAKTLKIKEGNQLYVMWEWRNVTDKAIHAVAKQNGIFKDLAKHGGKRFAW